MKALFFAVFLHIVPSVALAVTLISGEYVDEKIATKVDTSETAKQTMAGEHTVSGTLIVPTPLLPSAD